MKTEKLHREHTERVRASQRRGHWLPLTRRIAAFRTAALGTLGQDMLTQAEIDLEKLETEMNAAAQEPCRARVVPPPPSTPRASDVRSQVQTGQP